MKNVVHISTIAMMSLLISSVVLSTSYAEQRDVGFGIFLKENNELILSDKHITWYHRETHEIELNANGQQQWASYIEYDTSVEPPIPKLRGLYTKDFVVKIRGNEIYQGKFWSLASSARYDGIVLVDVLGVLGERIRIQAGYPDSSANEKPDPRERMEIISYFKEHGLLKDSEQ